MSHSYHPLTGDHNFSDDFSNDAIDFSFLGFFGLDSSLSMDMAVEEITGAFNGGESCSTSPPNVNYWNGLPNLTAPVSPSDFHKSTAVNLSSSPIPFGMPHQDYPSSSTLWASDEHPTTNPQLLITESVLSTNPESRIVKKLDKPDDDGYNWRKYGHKVTTDGEYSRSYYKCTERDCHPVRKRVQNAVAGHITEIIYSGYHNHEPSRPEKRANDIIDAYMTFEDDEKEESACVEVKFEAMMSNGTYGRVMEPKIVVQTTSEVDVLDDGFRWRKYGDKVIKGNHNPRFYYKCTTKDCEVRKQVERSSKEPTDVITTYFGKHNHETKTVKLLKGKPR